jgi:ribosome recycling factor
MTNAQDVIKDATTRMDGALAALKDRFSGLRTGKASPSLVDSLQVPYYGVPTRLKDMANISTPEARQITIAPFDPSVLSDIEKAILAANLGVTPRNDGRMIRIMMPELTEQRRKEIVKVAKTQAEECRVAIRNVRRDANDHIKALQKDAKISEDEAKKALDDIQKLTDSKIAKVDADFKAKEAEVMAV